MRRPPHLTAVGVWLVAVAGAGAVVLAPLTAQVVAPAVAGGAVCLSASTALALWFVRP